MTVQDLIQQMEFAQYVFFALSAMAAFVYLLVEARISYECHRIWKALRKLEKEKLELELKMLKKDE